MSETNLGDGRGLQAGGFFSTRQVDLAADTYYVGMRLESAAGVYGVLAAGVLAGIYNGTDERVLAAPGVDDVIVAGEISHAKIVDDAGVAVVLTATQIALYAQSGFYIKEN